MNLSSLRSDALFAVGRHLVGALSGLIALAVVARALGPEGLAATALLGTSVFVVGLADLGLSTVVQRAVVQGDLESLHREIRRVISVLWITAPMLALVVMGITGLELRGNGISSDGTIFFASLITAIVASVASAYALPLRTILITAGQLKPVASARFFSSVAQLVVLGLMLWVSRNLLAPALAIFAASVVETYILHKGVTERFGAYSLMFSRDSLQGTKHVLKGSLATLVLNLAVIAAIRIDVTILAHYAPLAAVAAYSVASRSVDQAFSVIKQFSTALLSRLAKAEERQQAVVMSLRWGAPLVSVIMIALYFTAHPWFVLWVGETANSTVFVTTLALLGGASVLAALSETACSLMTLAAPSIWDGAKPILIGSIVNVLVSVVGAHYLGAVAIAAGTVIGNSITVAVAWHGATKLTGWSYWELLGELKTLAITVAIALVLGTVLAGFADSLVKSAFISAVVVVAPLLIVVLVNRVFSVGRVTSNAIAAVSKLS